MPSHKKYIPLQRIFSSVLALIPFRRIRVIDPELDPGPREISPGEKSRKIA